MTLLAALPTDLPALRRMGPAQWRALLDAPASDALAWLTTAAREGHAGAQALLGQWLLDGRGTAGSQPRQRDAFAWFLKAAQQGEAMGMNMTGRCYENGWGVARDLQAAIRWFRRAADRDLDAGLHNLANQLASGAGLPRDDTRALALYQRAAGLGHAKSMTKAGRHHEEGLGTPSDAAAARDWYRRGAEGGDFRGQYHHARMLATDGRVDEALAWLRRLPATATPGFLDEVGRLLSASPDALLRMLGDELLAHAHAPAGGSAGRGWRG